MLLKEVAALKEDMRRKTNALLKAIPAATLTTRVPLQNGLWRSEEELQDVLWYRVDIASDLVLVLSVVIKPEGWMILFQNAVVQRQSTAEQWFTQRGINHYHIARREPWRALIDDPAAPGYDADIEQVREWAMDYLEKVLPSV